MKHTKIATLMAGLTLVGMPLLAQTTTAGASPMQYCTPAQVQSGAGFNQCWVPGCPNPMYNLSTYTNCVTQQMFPPVGGYQQQYMAPGWGPDGIFDPSRSR